MKVGDYVRTETGQIGKITYFEGDMVRVDCDKFITYKSNHNEITKISPNIIDLIEEHDFVEIEYYSNRYEERVSRIFEVDFINNRDVCFENGYCRLNMFYGEWSNQDKLLNPVIKGIITHEQIESNKYKVKE